MSEKKKRGPRGMGTVFKKKSVWWIQYYHRKRRFRESSGSSRKKDATELLKQRLAEIHEGTFTPRRKDEVTFAAGVELLRADYRRRGHRSWSRCERSVKHLKEMFEGPLAETTATRLNRYATQRLDAGAARATVVNELATLKRIFTLAEEQNLVSHRPRFPKFGDLDNARQEFIEPDDYAALLATMAETDLDVEADTITFLYLTGWRLKSEVRTLTWRQVDFDRGEVTLDVGTTKNRAGRTFPFAEFPDLMAALERRRAVSPEGVQWVFHRDGQPFTATTDGFYALWKTVCKKANVLGKDGRPKKLHDFRRTAVRNLEWSGVPRKVAKALVGHKTDDVYDRYHIVRADDLREGVRRVAKHLADAPTKDGVRS